MIMPTPADEKGNPRCLKCDAPMRRQIAHEGGTHGRAYFRCARFPTCRGQGWYVYTSRIPFHVLFHARRETGDENAPTVEPDAEAKKPERGQWVASPPPPWVDSPRYYDQDYWKMPSSTSNNGGQGQPVMPKGLLLSWPSARLGLWYFGPSYFDDTL